MGGDARDLRAFPTGKGTCGTQSCVGDGLHQRRQGCQVWIFRGRDLQTPRTEKAQINNVGLHLEGILDEMFARRRKLWICTDPCSRYVCKSMQKSGTKNEPKPKLLSPDIFRWGRGLPREGVGPKSSVCPSKPGKSNFFGGISRDFAGKSLCSIFGPYKKSFHSKESSETFPRIS